VAFFVGETWHLFKITRYKAAKGARQKPIPLSSKLTIYSLKLCLKCCLPCVRGKWKAWSLRSKSTSTIPRWLTMMALIISLGLSGSLDAVRRTKNTFKACQRLITSYQSARPSHHESMDAQIYRHITGCDLH